MKAVLWNHDILFHIFFYAVKTIHQYKDIQIINLSDMPTKLRKKRDSAMYVYGSYD